MTPNSKLERLKEANKWFKDSLCNPKDMCEADQKSYAVIREVLEEAIALDGYVKVPIPKEGWE